MFYEVTGSVVLYKNKESIVRRAINSFLNCRKSVRLFVIDNSPDKSLQSKLNDVLSNPSVEYIYTNKNIGFGAAHNIAIEKSLQLAPYHVVLNPDIEFDGSVIDNMYKYMQAHAEVGQLLPKVYYPDGKLQKHCKLLPSPFDLMGRRFFGKTEWALKRNRQYELDDFNYATCLDTPNLCGCFMFLRTACLKITGGFDTRFFLYLEDVDLTRRIHRIAKTLFYPFVSIVHDYQRGSYSNFRLLKHHMVSAVKYFFKWGWFNDAEKEKFNTAVLNSIHFQKTGGTVADIDKRGALPLSA